MELLQGADLKFMSLKRVLLLALALAKQVNDINALSVHPSCAQFFSGDMRMILRPNPSHSTWCLTASWALFNKGVCLQDICAPVSWSSPLAFGFICWTFPLRAWHVRFCYPDLVGMHLWVCGRETSLSGNSGATTSYSEKSSEIL